MTIRVYTNEPTNWGDEKVMIKTFKNNEKTKALTYFNKLVKETKKEAKETDDVLYVIMEDVETGKTIKSKYFH